MLKLIGEETFSSKELLRSIKVDERE